MNLSMKWLNDYVDLSDLPIKEFCLGMTMSGSKVEGYEVEGAELENVVVGEILSVEPHENADTLVVCKVNVGASAPIQIVTGAPNVKAGDIVPVALHGSTLPGGVKIKKGKLRGVESQGMLCSFNELGLTLNDFPYADPNGILLLEEEDGATLEIGLDIRSALNLNDTQVEFEITSNRPDCLSVLGLAREASATFNRPLKIKEPEYSGADDDINALLKVKIHDEKLCPRYIAGVVKNVKIGKSPLWLRERLRACGVRPINNLVDITNFCMLEYGHPMHAFDIRCLSGNEINVRVANDGEKITTLDGVERELTNSMLVIADGEKPVAVAGVMGGEYSGITDDTVDVVFESACFNGGSVRNTAKALGMRSDASARFEKGLDPQNALAAIKRAFELVEMLDCGNPVKNMLDNDYSEKSYKGVKFNPAWINAFLGADIPEADMTDYITRLGFTVKGNMVYAPAVRIDIECEADIAEEIARIYGYNNIPRRMIEGVAKASVSPAQKFERAIKAAMTAAGANEIITYSFTSPKNFEKLRLQENNPLRKAVVITNPLGEDASVMRTTMLPSMLEILARNYNNRNPQASLFELGKEYIPAQDGGLPNEVSVLCLGMYGVGVDFYDLKGIIESLLDKSGIKGCEYAAPNANDENFCNEESAFHGGRCALISKDGVYIGIMGEIHPETAQAYEIETKVYSAKLLIPAMQASASAGKLYKPLPKFPAAVRDIAVVCDDDLPAAAVEKAIAAGVGNILESVALFDVYKGKQIPEGKKSLAYSITMRSPKATLTDEEADKAVSKALKALSALGAEIRG
ncbi:MAG: phenylalanine--tRNA ligase subunit beta [Oscillospiraceae bacterium]|nr:phenylalanine--tRNA ligase subunit beta [Oscillospiraceae bacterium]